MKNAVLVIGASSDIGHAVIEKLVTSNTVIAHTNTTSLRFGRFSGHQKEEIHQVQADLSDEESVSSLIQTILEMSVIPTKVVHLAAIPPENTRLTELAWLDYERHLSVNVKSFQIIVSNLLPTMVKQRHGRIVTMSTSYIHGCPPPFLSHYVTAKYALEGMTKAIASEFGKKGITANSISAGMVSTRFLRNLHESIVESARAKHPLGRLARAEEIAAAVCFLLSEESSYINGENLKIDGGI